MQWLVHIALDRGRDRELEMMGFYNILCIVHTTQGQGQVQGNHCFPLCPSLSWSRAVCMSHNSQWSDPSFLKPKNGIQAKISSNFNLLWTVEPWTDPEYNILQHEYKITAKCFCFAGHQKINRSYRPNITSLWSNEKYTKKIPAVIK